MKTTTARDDESRAVFDLTNLQETTVLATRRLLARSIYCKAITGSIEEIMKLHHGVTSQRS